MNPVNPEEVKAKIIAELEIAHLPQEEQETIIATLAEALLERATTIIMAKMPETEFANVDALAEAGDQEALKAKIIEFVPDAPQIVDTVVRDGVAEYKQLVEQEKTGDMQAPVATEEPVSATFAPAAPEPTPIPEVAPEPAPAPVAQEENFIVDDSGEAQPSTSLADSVTPAPQQPAY